MPRSGGQHVTFALGSPCSARQWQQCMYLLRAVNRLTASTLLPPVFGTCRNQCERMMRCAWKASLRRWPR